MCCAMQWTKADRKERNVKKEDLQQLTHIGYCAVSDLCGNKAFMLGHNNYLETFLDIFFNSCTSSTTLLHKPSVSQ